MLFHDGLLASAAVSARCPRLEAKDPRSGTVGTTARHDPAKATCMAHRLTVVTFLDREPDPGEVPKQILEYIAHNIDLLRAKWDEIYPENPINSQEGPDE